jgi:hypothetical protein
MSEPRKKVIVFHSFYGCDTGCCGHVVQVGDEEHFQFAHPWDDVYDLSGPDREERMRKWAEELVRDTFGPEHVADLDWENCVIVDD